MANNAYETKQWKKAEQLFKVVIQQFISQGMSSDSNGVIEASLKLSVIYSHLEEYDKAIEGYKFCVNSQGRKVKDMEGEVDEDTLLLYAMSLDETSKFLMKHNDFELAEEYLLEAYRICVRHKGYHDEQTAVLLNDLGTLNHLMNKEEKAVEYIEQAIKIAEYLKVDELCVYLINLGRISKGSSGSKSVLACEKALALARKLNNALYQEEANNCINESSHKRKLSQK